MKANSDKILNPLTDSKFRLKLFFKISSITISTTLFFFLIGYLLDYHFKTKPLYTIILVIGSFPVFQIILYKYVRKLNKDLTA